MYSKPWGLELQLCKFAFIRNRSELPDDPPTGKRRCWGVNLHTEPSMGISSTTNRIGVVSVIR